MKKKIIQDELGKKKGRGRPFQSYKYGELDVFQYKKLLSKIKTLQSLRRELVQDLEKEVCSILKLDLTLFAIDKKINKLTKNGKRRT